MNRKQLCVLLALVIVLGALGWMLYQRNQTSWQSAGQSIGKKLLGDLPINEVAALVIRGSTNELDLVKKDNRWRVAQRHDYPANYSDISAFLIKAADLKATQTEEIGPSQLGRFKLLPPGPATNTGILVEFKDATGKTLKSLLLGKQHMRKGAPSTPMGLGEGEEGYPDGRYVMVGTGAKTVALLNDPLGNMDVKPDQWLSKDFFKVEKIRAIAATFPAATNSWKVTRDTETGDWKLADAKPDEKLDSAKTSNFSYALSSPTFNDVLPLDTQPAPAGWDKPTTITLDTFDHFTYTLKIGAKTNDNVPVELTVTADLPKERTPGKDEKKEDKDKLDKEFKDKQKVLEDKLAQEKPLEKWIYLVSSWTVDPLLKDRSQILVEKKAESKKDGKAGTDDENKDQATSEVK